MSEAKTRAGAPRAPKTLVLRAAAGAGAAALAGILALAAPAAAADLADAEAGAQVWKKCKSCHMVGEDARNRVGPHLNGVFGRRAATVEDYRYSKDMQRAGDDGLTWTTEKLDIYIENPKALVTGTRMAFRGIKDPQDRANLIAFLRGYTASPSDIPESAPTAAPRDPDVDPAILAIQGDPAYGEYLSSECVTCHQADGADRGIPSIVGWPAEDFVTAMHAYKNEHRPHPVMRMMAQRLSDEEIAGLAAWFAEAH
ncbi:c-type cytochrome [Rhodovulum sp. DZ06]|uniref:c-type cytochrome n=1 Tax=Rhodovulum sp. DZ06 TaxID=3425126 RepID=UPI003D32D13D